MMKMTSSYLRRVALSVAVVFIILRAPLLSRAIRHAWYEDMNGHYGFLILSRSFIEEGGRTPFFLFPRWSARVDSTEPWNFHASFPPLSNYISASVFVLPTNPHVHAVIARLVAVLLMAVSSLMVFYLFIRLTNNPLLALMTQFISLFEVDRFYFSDLNWYSQWSYPILLAQTFLFLGLFIGSSSRRLLILAHLVSIVGALTSWLNPIVPIVALGLAFLMRAEKIVKRRLLGVAISSTVASVGVMLWLAASELLVTGVHRGTGMIGTGVPQLTGVLTNWLTIVDRVGPVAFIQTYLDWLLRFILPPIPVLSDKFALSQQLIIFGLHPRIQFTVDQILTFPFVLLGSCFALILAWRGLRLLDQYFTKRDQQRAFRFGLLLFTLPGVLYCTILSSWSYFHHAYARMMITPFGMLFAVCFYQGVGQLLAQRNWPRFLARPRVQKSLVVGWLVLWATSGVNLTYSIVRESDDGYNRAVLAASDWFRENATVGSTLVSNEGPTEWGGRFVVYYSDARVYSWSRSLNPLVLAKWVTVGYVDQRILPVLDHIQAQWDNAPVAASLGELSGLQTLLADLETRLQSSQSSSSAEAEQTLDDLGKLFSGVRDLNRELVAQGFEPVDLGLPQGWSRHDNYILYREDFGFPPLFQGMDYEVVFVAPFDASPAQMLGHRPALDCEVVLSDSTSHDSCSRAFRDAVSAAMSGNWAGMPRLSLSTSNRSGDAFQPPLPEGVEQGKFVLARLIGE